MKGGPKTSSHLGSMIATRQALRQEEDPQPELGEEEKKAPAVAINNI